MGRRLYRPSLIVAIAMMLAVPFATLEVPDIVASCCCPSPAVCRCPDHKGDAATHATLGRCHRTARHLQTSKLASFAAPTASWGHVPPALALVAPAGLTSPHPAPPPRPPDAPS